MMEQVDAKIVSVVLSSILSENDVEASVKSRSLSSCNAGTVHTLNSEEEASAGKYRKMLKMHIPKDAVRHKIKMEQADPKIILPERKIVGERTQFIKALLPQQQELQAVKAYDGDDSAL